MSDVLPPDLSALRGHVAGGGELPWPGFRLLEEGETPAALDTSYLTAEDRANPDIAGNVEATAETAAFARWIVRSEEGDDFGYWRGPEDVALVDAPIVHYDNEGQFELLQGATLSEALTIHLLWLDEDDAGATDALRSLGIELGFDDHEAVPEPEVATPPDVLHDRLYREKTGQAG